MLISSAQTISRETDDEIGARHESLNDRQGAKAREHLVESVGHLVLGSAQRVELIAETSQTNDVR
jgi:hypothetical protein